MTPKVVATVGLHGSASTWVFNVAREAMIAAYGQDQVLTVYTEDVGTIPEAAGRALVMKSHHGSPGLDTWLAQAGALMLLSVRDPRDAAISMAQRFKAPLPATVRWIQNDCARMRHLVAAGHPLFRYEDRFFEDETAVSRVAALLDVDLDADVIGRIASKYRPEAVQRFIQTFDELPPGRVARSEATVVDTVTHIHRTHIGDARSGKWRELAPVVQVEITKRFEPFLRAFDYPF